MRALISRYPDFYAGSAEFVDLQTALEPEVLELWTARDGLLDQLAVETATWGLQYWEKTLGLSVEQSKEIAYRRSRIRSKLRGAGVTTVALIESVAESFSNGEVELTEFPLQFRLLGHRLVNLLPVLIERCHLCPVGFLRQIQPEICCLIHVHATPFT